MASPWMENPTDKDRLLLKRQLCRRYWCEDNDVAFTNAQLHYYRVRQVEPCHHLGWSSQALILSSLALGAMPKQQQQQQQQQLASALYLQLFFCTCLTHSCCRLYASKRALDCNVNCKVPKCDVYKISITSIFVKCVIRFASYQKYCLIIQSLTEILEFALHKLFLW